MTTAPKRRMKTKAPGVFRSSSGAYEVVYRDSDGKLRSKVAGTDFEAAKATRADIVAKMAKGERVSRTKVVFQDYAAEWLALQKTAIRPRTYEVYESARP